MQTDHDRIVEQVKRRYANRCKLCFHDDYNHEGNRAGYSEVTERYNCRLCPCAKFRPMSPLDICEMVEVMKTTDAKGWREKLASFFHDF